MRGMIIGLCLLAAGAEAQQCPGDLDDDGQVSVSELVTAVNSALNGCAQPTPTPTPTASGRCAWSFNRETPSTPQACTFFGKFGEQSACSNFNIAWISDGAIMVFSVWETGFEPSGYLNGEVQDSTHAALTSWSPQIGVFNPMTGSVVMADADRRLIVDANGIPFSIGGCGFDRFDGRYIGQLGEVGTGGGMSDQVPADIAGELARQIEAVAGR